MIDFTTLQGLTIPEGVVTQIEDASGRVIWAVQSDEPIVLEVEKIISNTYAAETTYENEEFILLDIYPKTNGTVNITYGGLTKTITDTSGAESPNAQQVFFGKFNGVTDSVATASSGELVIEGEHRGVAVGVYNTSSKSPMGTCCDCVKEVKQMNVDVLPNAFNSNTKLTKVYLQNGVTSVGDGAFYGCTGLQYVFIPKTVKQIEAVNVLPVPPFSGTSSIENPIVVDSENAYYHIDGNCLIRSSDKVLLAGFINSVIPSGVTAIADKAFSCYSYADESIESITIPDSVTRIGGYVFNYCKKLSNVSIGSGVSSINKYIFNSCTNVTSVTFKNPNGWYVTETPNGDISTGTAVDLSNPTNNATLFTDTYAAYYWYRS